MDSSSLHRKNEKGTLSTKIERALRLVRRMVQRTSTHATYLKQEPWYRYTPAAEHTTFRNGNTILKMKEAFWPLAAQVGM
jgi:hypothetical protein